MNDGVSMQPGAWGQVRVREPAGERVLGETLSIGGAGSDVVVPGVDAGAALSVRRQRGLWLVQPAPAVMVRFNGRPLSGERDLRRDDVLSVGDAQVRVSDASRTLLRLSVEHLAGARARLPRLRPGARSAPGGSPRRRGLSRRSHCWLRGWDRWHWTYARRTRGSARPGRCRCTWVAGC